MEIRPYRDSDLPAIVDVHRAAVHEIAREHYDAAQREAWAPRVPDLDAWRARMAAVSTLVAVEGDSIAGFCAFAVRNGKEGHVDLLFTAPAHARRGVAAALYACAEADLREAGVPVVVTEASLVARRFFASRGFAVVEEQQVRRGGVTLRRFAMRKLLA